MSGIFPPLNQGGVPPSINTNCTYTPINGVTGEGPLYVSANCTTTFTDCMYNSLASEILAAVDLLGFSYNANRQDNLGQAITARLQATGDGQWVIRTGDTMTGALHLPPVMPVFATQATHKAYVDRQDAVVAANLEAGINTAKAELTALINGKVNRSGDTMTGSLILWRDPVLTMEAATRGYVDKLFSTANLGIQHAPNDGAYYASYLGRWEAFLPFPEAPLNNLIYGRRNGQWQIVQGGGGGGEFPEAPKDGQTYGRKDGAWSVTLTHAPEDGRYYASRNGIWEAFDPGAGGGGGEPGPLPYVRLIGDDMTGRLLTPRLAVWDANFYLTRFYSTGFIDPITEGAAVVTFGPGNFLMFDNSATFSYTSQGVWAMSIESSGAFSIRGEGWKPGGGLWASGSDERIKNILGDYTGGLAQILELQPRIFTYKNNDRPPSIEEAPNISMRETPMGGTLQPPIRDSSLQGRDIPERPIPSGREFVGLVAQEVENIMPELVSQRPGWIDGQEVFDMRSLDATPLIYALVNAVKELSARVAALEAAR